MQCEGSRMPSTPMATPPRQQRLSKALGMTILPAFLILEAGERPGNSFVPMSHMVYSSCPLQESRRWVLHGTPFAEVMMVGVQGRAR